MNFFEAHIIRLSDPLSPHTRSVRKSLLIVSVVAIFISATGLIPTKISALGIEFSQANRESMLSVLGLVVTFLLVSFAVAASADFVAWRISFQVKAWNEADHDYDNARKLILERKSLADEDREELEKIWDGIEEKWHKVDSYSIPDEIVRPISWARITVEFIAPFAAGILGLSCLIRALP